MGNGNKENAMFVEWVELCPSFLQYHIHCLELVEWVLLVLISQTWRIQSITSIHHFWLFLVFVLQELICYRVTNWQCALFALSYDVLWSSLIIITIIIITIIFFIKGWKGRMQQQSPQGTTEVLHPRWPHWVLSLSHFWTIINQDNILWQLFTLSDGLTISPASTLATPSTHSGLLSPVPCHAPVLNPQHVPWCPSR